MWALLLMKKLLPFHMQDTAVQPRAHAIALLLAGMFTIGPVAFAEDNPPVLSEQKIAERARAAWENGAANGALDLLDQGIQDHPQALTLYKLRGDILATSRGAQEAVRAYDTVLANQP